MPATARAVRCGNNFVQPVVRLARRSTDPMGLRWLPGERSRPGSKPEDDPDWLLGLFNCCFFAIIPLIFCLAVISGLVCGTLFLFGDHNPALAVVGLVGTVPCLLCCIISICDCRNNCYTRPRASTSLPPEISSTNLESRSPGEDLVARHAAHGLVAPAGLSTSPTGIELGDRV